MPKKILIVDDEEEIRELLVALLKRNYDTLSAQNGREALDASRGNSDLSLVLMDTDMPGLNGYEVCKSLRDEGYNGIIIGMSGNHSIEYKKRWQEAHANDFLEKPVSLSILSKKIKQYLGE